MGMNQHELEQFITTITPEKVRQVAIALWKERRREELRAVALYRVVQALVLGVTSPELPSYWPMWAAVREAVVTAARQANDMTYVEAT